MGYKFNLSNPLFIYTFVWLLTLFLDSLQATTNLKPLNNETIILVVSNICTFAIIYSALTLSFPCHKTSPISDSALFYLKRFAKKLLLIWLIGTIIEIILCGGVPIVWTFTNPAKNYTDFGIHSFHGLMNAIYLFSVTALYLNYLKYKNKDTLLLIICLLLWPLIMIERGILLGALLQMLGVYLLINKIRFASLLKLSLTVFALIILFGIVGDIRVYAHPFASMVASDYKDFFNAMPSGFLWVYVYITSPINNIVANIQHLNPTYSFFYSLVDTIPTAIRDHFVTIDATNPMSLAIKGLNVSTFYPGFLADFDILGAIAIVAAIQFFISWIYLSARRLIPYAILIYSVLFQCIVFSIFFNLFLLPVYIMQIIIAFAFAAYLKAQTRTATAKTTQILFKNELAS